MLTYGWLTQSIGLREGFITPQGVATTKWLTINRGGGEGALNEEDQYHMSASFQSIYVHLRLTWEIFGEEKKRNKHVQLCARFMW